MKKTPLCVYCGRGECNQQLDSNYYHEACFRSAIQKGIDCACPKCEGKRKAEVKQTPILFSSPMVRAILDGRKTMTRRVIKPQPLDRDGDGKVLRWNKGNSFGSRIGLARDCPYGQDGDHLWVRETFQLSSQKGGVYFRATNPSKYGPTSKGWKPSIHMPRCASRLTLEITAVRVERLQSISREDAIAEGLPFTNHCWKDEWRNLWNSINGKRHGGIYAWDKDPWVWVISFKKL